METGKLTKDRLVFELMLIVVAIGMAYLLYRMGRYSVVVLNLFYLPIVLSAYFMGRRSAGILSFFCVVSVTIALTLGATGFAAYNSPIMLGLVITVWAAVLGLTSMLVGTLSDERADKLEELHEAYVGVVDVLSAYLQSANPKYKARSIRVAEISQAVAAEMKLTPAKIDDVRIAALLHDMGNVEITTRMLSRAVDSLEREKPNAPKHTFLGSDLVHSLGSVMHGAVPLVLAQNDDLREVLAQETECEQEIPVGAAIIRVVRAFDELVAQSGDPTPESAVAAIRRLQGEPSAGFDDDVLVALEHVVKSGRANKQLQAAAMPV